MATTPPPAAAIAVKKATSLHQLISETLIPHSKISEASKLTLLRLVSAELGFLSHLSTSAYHIIGTNPNSSHLRSSNIGYLKSIVRILQSPGVTKVSRVCKPVAAGSVHVDVVCTVDKTTAWILVSDRNPKYVSWRGSRRRSKGVGARVEEVLASARRANSLKPEIILLFFCSGVSDDVRQHLVVESSAVEISGEEFGCQKPEARVFKFRVALPSSDPDSDPEILESGSECINVVRGTAAVELDSDDVLFCNFMSGMRSTTSPHAADEDEAGGGELVNFDTTALIALVSGISNGGTARLLGAPEIEMRKRFKGNYEFVLGQVRSELSDPILVELKAEVAGKRGIICETVHLEFMELVSMCGGPKEKHRANHLLNWVMILPDCPSARILALPTTRKIAYKKKIVFGTGDHWRAPTLTANTGFVRAISQIGETETTSSSIHHHAVSSTKKAYSTTDDLFAGNITTLIELLVDIDIVVLPSSVALRHFFLRLSNIDNIVFDKGTHRSQN